MKITTLIFFYLILIPIIVFSQKPSTSQKLKSNNSDTLKTKAIGNLVHKLAEQTRKADSLETILDSSRANTVNKNLSGGVSSLLAFKTYTITLALSILLFGMVTILSILTFLFKLNKGFGNYVFQSLGLVIVVTSTLFLIVTGYDKDQITPVIGLFGTIVGFIFGSNLNNNKNHALPKNDNNENQH